TSARRTLLRGVRIGICNRHQQLLRVGRPVIAAEAAFEVRELLRFTAASIQQPDLIALGLARTAGGEREISSVATPSRCAFTVRTGSHAEMLCAIPTAHPDIGVALIARGVDGTYRIRHPFSIRGDLRIGDIVETVHVVELQQAFGWSLGEGQSNGSKQSK